MGQNDLLVDLMNNLDKFSASERNNYLFKINEEIILFSNCVLIIFLLNLIVLNSKVQPNCYVHKVHNTLHYGRPITLISVILKK